MAMAVTASMAAFRSPASLASQAGVRCGGAAVTPSPFGRHLGAYRRRSYQPRRAICMASTTTPLVKICGVAHPEDALYAAKAGATFIGMIMTPGYKRSVDTSLASDIAAAAKEGGATPVGVFVKEGAPELVEACDAAGLSYVQLHGDDARAGLSKIPMKLGAIWVVSADAGGKIQGYLPGQKEDEDQAAVMLERGGGNKYGEKNPMTAAFNFVTGGRRTVDYILVDGIKAGSGETFDWKNLKSPRGCSRKGWALAGGLDPDNVAEAIKITRPNIVDTSSGVCGPDGIRKDQARIDAFIAAVRSSTV